ncbi:NLR family CARD domain-containing protein 4-like isoform X2 [Asterias amurensis]|uniref:NLR family CARD domain-containing protein 4-like isoform X2 n=1 Tax=Asterias amurensis TaxID=7602 RepID=UPI003AB1C01B
MKHQSREGLVTQQSASTEKQDCLVQSQRTSPRIGAIPKNTRGRKEQMKPQSQTKEKNHLSASVHLLEEPEQSISSTAGIINEIASNCHSKDIVPAVHQDLATISQSSDALTLVHHQSQAMVNNMSIGDGSNVFMAPASGITFNKNINHVTGTPDPSHQAQAISDELTEALKKVYMNTGSFVQMLPWVDDDQIHIMDIYTKLVLVVLNDKVGKIVKEKIQMKSYEDIFHLKTREDNLIKRVVFSGSAGLGKTTLCDKIAYDWAVGKSEILKRFELVFVLKMRSLTTATDLIDAVADQLIERDIVKRCDLKGFIDKNQDKVLILLDGFDEFQTTQTEKSSFGSILKALNRKQYKDCWVVIASRPPLDQLVSSSLVEKPFTHVEVEGFSATDIKNYVNKFFPKDLENVRNLIEKIQSSEVLSDLAKSPMLLLLMCLLWRESGKLPETMTRLYTEALKYIFRRKAKDLSQDEVSQILISIGKVALHGLNSTNQFLSFKEKDFDKKAFDAAIRAGVLTSERVFKELDAHNNVYFINKTFLEFCAAMYWQSLINTEEFEDILVRVCSASRIYPSTYEYLLRFCCGDNEECTNKVLQNLQKNEDLKLGFICYFESQSKNLQSEDFINAVVRTEISINEWNSDFLDSFFHLVKQIGNQKKIQGSAYLSSVNRLFITACDLRWLGNGLANCFTNMINISYLELTTSNLCSSASLWASHLKRMKLLNNLILKNCCLLVHDVAPIAESVSNMPTLVELDLSLNTFLGGWDLASVWATHLKRMKHLKNLRLSNCNLIGEDMAPIAESVSDMPTLNCLDLSRNYDLGGCASLWATHLKQMNHLKNLSLALCQLIGEDMAHIAESVSDMPTLNYLDLSWNDDLGDCASLWATDLKRMKHLKNLRLSNCNLIGEDMAPIAESVSDMPTLNYLDLSRNYDLGGCASLWASHLKQMNHLKNLSLALCQLIGEDMAHIAESVSDMPTLNYLDLSWNDDLGDCASLWATHLKRMKHLKNLSLGGCKLIGEDMARIAESVSDMPTLNYLDLSWNYDLGDCASLWATDLKRMKHLTKLGLRLGTLTEEKRRLINDAWKDITTLDVEMD